MPSQLEPLNSSGVYIVIDTQLGSGQRIRRGAVKVERFSVETSLDNDADTFSVEIGTPNFDLNDIVTERDEEVRVQLWFQGPVKVGTDPQIQLFTGFADNIVLDNTGTLSLNGRDVSSIATDSQPSPGVLKNQFTNKLITKEALALGFPSTYMGSTPMVRNFFRDGNETYWESWFRMIRRYSTLWLWCNPNGVLIAGPLNYNASDISYFFGDKPTGDDDFKNSTWTPITSIQFSKNTQTRIGRLKVFWQNNKQSYILPDQVDPTIQHWVRNPQKIEVNSTDKSREMAQQTAWEEISDGRVGSLEISLTVPFTGLVYEQNKICRVHSRDMGIDGNFFVVGVNFLGDENGFYQQIRLREIGFALPTKKPDDIQIIFSSAVNKYGGPNSAGAKLIVPGASFNGTNMGDWFVQAAYKTWKLSGIKDRDKWVAAVIAVSHRETGGSFKNELEGGIEYYPLSVATQPTTAGSITVGKDLPPLFKVTIPYNRGETEQEWRDKFKNESPDKGVGPMQLTTVGIKHTADDDYKKGYHDQWQGGRWHPKSNIYAGALALAKYTSAYLGTTSSDDEMLRSGLRDYNAGPNAGPDGRLQGEKYAAAVLELINKNPNYYKMVQNYSKQVAQDNKLDIALLPKILIVRDTGQALYKSITNNDNITFAAGEKDQITKGRIDNDVLWCINAMLLSGFKITISALRDDHDKYSSTNNISQHSYGLAFDNSAYNSSNLSEARTTMKWLYENRSILRIYQILGPDKNYWWHASGPKYTPDDPGIYGASSVGNSTDTQSSLLSQHQSHIHVGFYNTDGFSSPQNGQSALASLVPRIG